MDHLFIKSLVKLNERPIREIKKLQFLNQQQQNNQKTSNEEVYESQFLKCINEKCQSYNIIFCERDGYYVCTDCGSVCNNVPVFQEFSPFFYKSVKSTDDHLSNSTELTKVGRSRKYYRLFHFNEILAAFNIQGPKINNRDMEVIKTEIFNSGLKRHGKYDIQRIQRVINKKYGVDRFSKNYGEKWIQIIYRIFKKRPEPMSNYLKSRLRHIFKTLLNTWPYVRHMVKGSRKNKSREQFFNFTVTLAEILKREFHEEWEKYKEWLPLLSEKKLKQLTPCFDYMFYLADFSEEGKCESDDDDEDEISV